jgi:hypothetical protein
MTDLAREIGPVETAARFLTRRTGDARPSDVPGYLDLAGNEPPMADDEL